MKRSSLFLILIFSVIPFLVSSQDSTKHKISGRIADDASNEPLIGATIIYEAAKGTATDIDGLYSLNLPDGDYELTASFVGYKPVTQKIKINGKNREVNFKLQSSTNLDEVEIVADVAKIRETPIAMANISAKQIKEELGARDLPMLLNSTPGVYASQQGGGAGDARVNIRGFDQRYIAVMVDGVPVNDMENGQVYWSNWAGLSEVTRNLQVQRGLGASRLAVPSVGGVMNVITSSVDQKRYFVVKNDMGTNNYQRVAIGYNSGLIKNKIGVTLSGSYTGGDGWVDMTWQKVWSYFAKLTWRINSRNLIVFGFNGAPQSHGQKSTKINMAFYDRTFAMKQGIHADSLYAASNGYTNGQTGARGLQYNPDWGYVNGKPVNTKINYFHKPLVNLSYFLTINPRLFFSNVLYYSMGTGGGTSINTTPSIDYTVTGTGQLQLQAAYNNNQKLPPVPDYYLPGIKKSGTYIYSSINNHKWIGSFSTLKYKFSQNLDFLGGIDARYYTGVHYQTPYNLLGGDYAVMASGKDASLQPYTKNPMSYLAKVGDKINYYYSSRITWLGLFGQAEYKTDKLSTFVTVTGSQTSYQNFNYFAKKDVVISKNNVVRNAVGFGDTLYYDGSNYGVLHNPYSSGGQVTHNNDGSITFIDNISTKKVTIGPNASVYTNKSSQARTNTTPIKMFTGYTVKGGMNYKLDRNNNVFVNAGYMNIAPKYNNVFDPSGVELSGIRNQLIMSGEIGYGITFPGVAANINGYMTRWDNKPLDYPISYANPDNLSTIYYNVPGVDAFLKGIEADFTFNITRYLKAQGFAMLADWRWVSGSTAYVTSDTGTPIDTITFDATGVHLGNSPQRQVGGSLRFEAFKGFYIKPQYTYFDKMYAQFDPTALQVIKGGKDYRRYDSWRVPGYGLFDLFMGYTIKTEKSQIDIITSINNVTNVVYIADAAFPSGGSPDRYNALNSVGYMGLGRRINVGVKVTF